MYYFNYCKKRGILLFTLISKRKWLISQDCNLNPVKSDSKNQYSIMIADFYQFGGLVFLFDIIPKLWYKTIQDIDKSPLR